jgi:hypothetical protein
VWRPAAWVLQLQRLDHLAAGGGDLDLDVVGGRRELEAAVAVAIGILAQACRPRPPLVADQRRALHRLQLHELVLSAPIVVFSLSMPVTVLICAIWLVTRRCPADSADPGSASARPASSGSGLR